MKRNIAVVHGHPIISVLAKGLSKSLNNLIGTPGVARIRRSQLRPFHVGPEMLLMRNHHVDSPLPMIMTIHIHALGGRLSRNRLTCLGQTRTIHEKQQAP
jgi:hypothetical protein